MKNLAKMAAVAIVVCGAAGASMLRAAAIETDSTNAVGTGGSGTYAVSSTDLVEGLTPATGSSIHASSEDDPGSDQTGAVLTNGAFGLPGLGGSQSTVIGNGDVVIYHLTGAATINEIDTYSAWQDNGRSAQNYTVSVSANGIGYTDILTVASTNGAGGGAGTDPAVKVAITDSLGGSLATGVNFVKFSFPSVENGYIGVRELDVIGTVPEPASLGLLGLGGLSLLVRRRKA